MWKLMTHGSILLWTVLLNSVPGEEPLTQTPPDAPGNGSSGIVVLTLHSEAPVGARPVRLRDVASLEAGNTELWERIAQLELEDAPEVGQTLVITRRLVSYRIQLAGLDVTQFDIRGSDRTSVYHQHELSPDRIITTAESALLERLPAKRTDIEIMVVHGPRHPTRIANSEPQSLKLEAHVPAASITTGMVTVPVRIYSDSIIKAIVPVTFRLQIYQNIPVALRNLNPGEVLTRDNVEFQRRSIAGFQQYVEPGDILNRKLRRPVRALEVIGLADLEAAQRSDPIVIQVRDPVQLITRVGTFMVKARGEAQQQGRSGQTIQVRNVDSNVIVRGRVVDSKTVEVPF